MRHPRSTVARLRFVTRPLRNPRGGFALLITITLLAFLVLLLVSLASLTRVETQVAANTQQQAQARQNALMALNIALGQLQKHTGPDQRVTARADLTLPAGVTVTPPTFNYNAETNVNGGKFTSPGSTGATIRASVDTYWADSDAPRNRHWTGVWRNTNTTPFDRNNPAAFNPAPGAPIWLVSGSEIATATASFSPTSPVIGLSTETTATTDTLRDSDAPGIPHRLLVGSATLGDTTLQHYVTAPQIPIRGTVPGLSGEQDIGHYAWWIGDEGIKARANLLDPFGPVAGTVPTSTLAPRNLKRRQSAQRPIIEAMTTNGNDGLAAFSDDFTRNEDLRGIFAASQFPLLNADDRFRTELGQRYHDVSIHSRGVLADTKNGGLKRDLTHILSRPTAAAFRAALHTPDYPVAPAAPYNIALTPAATPYATIPANEESPARAYDAGTGILAASATWEHLWSFYNLREPAPLGVFDGTTAAARPARADQQALYPLLVQTKLFYGLEVNGGAITLRITPVAVLANPYSVPISGEFILRFNNSRDEYPGIASGTLSDPPPAPDAPPSEALSYTTAAAPATPVPNQFHRLGNRRLEYGGLENITLVLRATSIPPGVAQIFTLDPNANLTIAGPSDTREVLMINTYDPSVYLTYPTGLSINTAAGHTHAAFYSIGMTPSLFIGSTNPEDRVSHIVSKAPAASSGAPVSSGFLVYPVDSGYQRGGGVFIALQDGKSALAQHAPFYQINTRALLNDYPAQTGSYGDHPLQWGVFYGVRGSQGDTDAGPHPLLSANILAPLNEAIPSTTRWGLVASGEFPSLNTPPPEVAIDASFINRLYDVPTPDAPITSLGQLQHFNVAGHLSTPVESPESLKTNGFLVNYPVANSYPGPRVSRHKVFHSTRAFGHHYDASYLWNDLLWDRFTFSTFPQTTAFTFGADEDGHLVNSRYRPFRSDIPASDASSFRGVFEPAKNLLVDGAFNINSTSVDAWKALFSALKSVPIGDTAAPSAPFSRTLSPPIDGGSTDARTGVSANAWKGFNDLTPDEIHTLAEEMVLQVRLRGPFLSLSEFVNRRLMQGPTSTSGTSPDPHRLGLSGALQTALDRTINHPAVAAGTSLVPEPYRRSSKRNETTGPRDGQGTPFHGYYFADLEYRLPSRIAGYPGYLLQADVLSVLAPALSARSDTFTIRTYGDVHNPVTGTVEARAWCEAVVQRLPDFIDPAATAADATPPPGSPNATFGRRYQVISFRWLTPADI